MNEKELKNLIIKIFTNFKLSRKHSIVCANAIMNAELVGAPSHGLSRLKMYCERISKKVINPRPKITVKNISKSISIIDADNSIGFVAADEAIKKTIQNAKKTGIGLVAVKNSGHYGLSGYYVERAVGGKKSVFGTNPICFGTQTNNKVPFILDTSMSMINRGKIRIAEKLGKKIPYGVALNKFGKPTTNAKEALAGVQLPIAGFRGSGLAWMVDILTGVFVGSNHGGKVKDPFDDFSGPQNIGHLFLAFKDNLFVKDYKKEIKKNIKRIKKIPNLKGQKIFYPGEQKFLRKKTNSKKSIKISKNIKKDLDILLAN